jgi:phosphohistidine phosphatase
LSAADEPRRLLLLRHGKSDWSAGGESDHARPLARRGEDAAEAVGRWITESRLTPDLVLSSTAVRARLTAELARESGGWTCPLKLAEELYGAAPERLLEICRALDPELRRPLLVGHQPAWGALVSLLAGGGRFRFPTGALAVLRCDGPWPDLSAGRAELELLLPPKRLPRS